MDIEELKLKGLYSFNYEKIRTEYKNYFYEKVKDYLKKEDNLWFYTFEYIEKDKIENIDIMKDNLLEYYYLMQEFEKILTSKTYNEMVKYFFDNNYQAKIHKKEINKLYKVVYYVKEQLKDSNKKKFNNIDTIIEKLNDPKISLKIESSKELAEYKSKIRIKVENKITKQEIIYILRTFIEIHFAPDRKLIEEFVEATTNSATLEKITDLYVILTHFSKEFEEEYKNKGKFSETIEEIKNKYKVIVQENKILPYHDHDNGKQNASKGEIDVSYIKKIKL